MAMARRAYARAATQLADAKTQKILDITVKCSLEGGVAGGMERHAKGIKIRKVQILRCRQYVNIR